MRVRSSDIQVTTSDLRVTSSTLRVMSSNVRVTSLNLWVKSSKTRVRKLKARVAGLKVQVGKLKAWVEAIEPIFFSRVTKSLNFFYFLSNLILSNYWNWTSHEITWRCPTLYILHKRSLKSHCLPFYYHHILEASKLGCVDSNETILKGTASKCNIFGREWF